MNAMRRVIRGALLTSMSVLAIDRLPGQLPGRTSQVRAVVDSFFSAAEREQWDAAAALMDTAKFGAYVRTQIRYARAAIPQRPMTAEDLMARDSTMPRAVAEWQVQQYRTASAMNGPFAFITTQFLGIKSPQDLAELTTMQALARWIAAKDPRARMRESAKLSGCPDTVFKLLPFEKSVIRGVAFDGDTTAYVIVTNEPPLPSGDGIGGGERIFALHPRGATWRIEPRRDLFTPTGFGFGGISCAHK